MTLMQIVRRFNFSVFCISTVVHRYIVNVYSVTINNSLNVYTNSEFAKQST